MKWQARTREAAVTKARANCKGYDKLLTRGAQQWRRKRGQNSLCEMPLKKSAGA